MYSTFNSYWRCSKYLFAYTPNDVVFLSGQQIESQQGSIIGLGGAVAQPTGQSSTASVGS